MHVHFIRTFKEFATFCCGYVFMATLEIKKTLYSGVLCWIPRLLLQLDLKQLFNLTERYMLI